MKNRIVFEDGLLRAMDDIAEQAEDDTTKMLSELLKSAILKPYKAAYYRELAKGKVHKENVENAVDLRFRSKVTPF
jgi:hypothetical protein